MFKKFLIILGCVILTITLLNTEGYGKEPRELFEEKCNACHSSERAKSLKKSKQDWEKTVLRMKNKKGSNISEQEAQIIIQFLNSNYGFK